MDCSRFIQKQVTALVIGTGISGLYTALKLASSGVSTLLLTKSNLAESNSRYAQGGIAAVLPSNPDDSLELHLQDTIRAAGGLCNEAAARSILAEAYPAIEDLLAYGVPFDRKQNQTLALTREAAHSVERILHAGGDATGHSVEMTLVERVKSHPLIEVVEYAQAVDLLMLENRCVGCQAVDYKNQSVLRIFSAHTVLATGGIGRLYSHTTNPAIATGDGIALAYRVGAAIENMAFIQFHPTAFYAKGQLQFLVSEALRGEGGILRNHAGERFALQYHADGELAPRDVVTRAIYAEMQASGQDYVYLDITHLPAATIELRFPTILANCLGFGVDIRRDWIPVAPAAHYLMGGVSVDVQGRTTIPGLYAVGEVAYTGLHGANRLASNSLLECVVLARRVAALVNEQLLCANEDAGQVDWAMAAFQEKSCPSYSFCDEQNGPHVEMISLLGELHRLMWQHVGILRNETGLQQVQKRLSEMLALVDAHHWALFITEGQELRNQLLVARLIVEEALARQESLGAHMRTDYPPADFGKPMVENAVSALVTLPAEGSTF